jgi:GNAT superfamily N-acetyltransferase
LQRRASLAVDTYREQLLAHPNAISLPAEQIAAGLVLVAELDGETAGFAVVLPRETGEAELDGLFVEPARWRTGVGRRLVEEAAGFAAMLGARRLTVVANPEAVGFYRRCGFVEAGATQTRFGPAPVMARDLSV